MQNNPKHSGIYPLAVARVRANLQGMTKPAPPKAIVKQTPLSERLPPYQLARFDSVAKCTENDVETSKIQEIMNLIWLPPSIGDAERDALLLKAIDLFESFEPGDGIEATLAVQMVGTHNATVECLRRAMHPDQPLEAQRIYLSQAERLMGLYTRHLDALAKHRGKAQPSITVGQVNVESGGQAIVGNVEAAKSEAAPIDTPLALAKPDTALPLNDFGVISRSKVAR